MPYLHRLPACRSRCCNCCHLQPTVVPACPSPTPTHPPTRPPTHPPFRPVQCTCSSAWSSPPSLGGRARRPACASATRRAPANPTPRPLHRPRSRRAAPPTSASCWTAPVSNTHRAPGSLCCERAEGRGCLAQLAEQLGWHLHPASQQAGQPGSHPPHVCFSFPVHLPPSLPHHHPPPSTLCRVPDQRGRLERCCCLCPLHHVLHRRPRRHL